jgi:hypothetical protein
MITKSAAALVAAGAICAIAPALSIAGGEIQEYEHARTTYQAAPAAYTNNAPPPSYVRPMGMYYGAPISPCASMPYGYGYACAAPCGGYGGCGGGLFGDPVFTAGLIGLGLGYLIWH